MLANLSHQTLIFRCDSPLTLPLLTPDLGDIAAAFDRSNVCKSLAVVATPAARIRLSSQHADGGAPILGQCARTPTVNDCLLHGLRVLCTMCVGGGVVLN